MDERMDSELRRLLDAGRKIEAIKTLREATGAGLAEAKAAVEALERGEPLAPLAEAKEAVEGIGQGLTPPLRAPARPLDPAFEAEVRRLAQHGDTIEAIRLYRERTGLGLKEAKDAVDALLGLRTTGGRSGCLGVLLAWILAP